MFNELLLRYGWSLVICHIKTQLYEFASVLWMKVIPFLIAAFTFYRALVLIKWYRIQSIHTKETICRISRDCRAGVEVLQYETDVMFFSKVVQTYIHDLNQLHKVIQTNSTNSFYNTPCGDVNMRMQSQPETLQMMLVDLESLRSTDSPRPSLSDVEQIPFSDTLKAVDYQQQLEEVPGEPAASYLTNTDD